MWCKITIQTRPKCPSQQGTLNGALYKSSIWLSEGHLCRYVKKKNKYNTLTGKEKHLAGWKTCVCVCDRHHTSYSLTWDLNQWPPWSVTFPAHCASPFSSAPSWLTNSSRFIISAAGSCSETHRTWKLNISTWSCFTYIGAFISHRWSFYCSFSILLWVICSVEGHLFSCSEKGLCQASPGF